VTLDHLHDLPILVLPADGPLIRDDIVGDVIGEVLSARAEFVVVPVERLGDDFFRLRTRIAGEIVQRFGYYTRLVVLGDISGYVAESTALRDFVYESNRGRKLWFLATVDELETRLAAERARA
jgi:hypothetical protein